MIAIVNDVGEGLGIEPTCEALGLSRATYYRHRNGTTPKEPKRRSPPKQALTDEERQQVLDVLHEEPDATQHSLQGWWDHTFSRRDFHPLGFVAEFLIPMELHHRLLSARAWPGAPRFAA